MLLSDMGGLQMGIMKKLFEGNSIDFDNILSVVILEETQLVKSRNSFFCSLIRF